MTKAKKLPFSAKGKNGVTYYLHIRMPAYYFAKKIRKNAVQTERPAGLVVKKMPTSGIPYLAKA